MAIALERNNQPGSNGNNQRRMFFASGSGGRGQYGMSDIRCWKLLANCFSGKTTKNSAYFRTRIAHHQKHRAIALLEIGTGSYQV